MADIVVNIEAARGYIGTIDVNDFLENDEKINAVLHRMQNASEATRRLNKSDPLEMEAIQARHPHANFKAFRGFSSKSRHGYDLMEALLVWEELLPNGNTTHVEEAVKLELPLSQVRPIELEPETKQEKKDGIELSGCKAQGLKV
ncbi:MAG TPA: HepT-like ribonuclease domain-containing protein [Candidatus Baltobacteraceae bacterium]|nr:HepT-like ribonuclease domain-containing protein [Candidatus Baltobacteraceae bacterium]